MDFASVVPCKRISSISHFSPTSLTHVGSPTSRRNLLIPRKTEVIFEPIFGSRNVKKCISRHRKPKMGLTLAANSDSSYETHSLSDVVKKFYRCINAEDRKGLEDIISSDCHLEDSAFPYIINGKKEVISLLIQLAESMGENVHFKLGTVCEGDELTASVNWHLEWKEDPIPFSKGCSIFQCSNEGDTLVIRKVQIITESPVKPGILAMALLKIVRSLFDEFPRAANWLLKRPQTILQAVLKIYGLFLAPIVNPIITFYITLWKFMARTLGYFISFLHIIARFFNKDSPSNDIDKDSTSNDIDKDSPSTDIENDTSNMEPQQGPSSLP